MTTPGQSSTATVRDKAAMKSSFILSSHFVYTAAVSLTSMITKPATCPFMYRPLDLRDKEMCLLRRAAPERIKSAISPGSTPGYGSTRYHYCVSLTGQGYGPFRSLHLALAVQSFSFPPVFTYWMTSLVCCHCTTSEFWDVIVIT